MKMSVKVHVNVNVVSVVVWLQDCPKKTPRAGLRHNTHGKSRLDWEKLDGYQYAVRHGKPSTNAFRCCSSFPVFFLSACRYLGCGWSRASSTSDDGDHTRCSSCGAGCHVCRASSTRHSLTMPVVERYVDLTDLNLPCACLSCLFDCPSKLPFPPADRGTYSPSFEQ